MAQKCFFLNQIRPYDKHIFMIRHFNDINTITQLQICILSNNYELVKVRPIA